MREMCKVYSLLKKFVAVVRKAWLLLIKWKQSLECNPYEKLTLLKMSTKQELIPEIQIHSSLKITQKESSTQ